MRPNAHLVKPSVSTRSNHMSQGNGEIGKKHYCIVLLHLHFSGNDMQ